jgi:glycosyltransferase involved in cell wall biosynthesis
MLFRNNKWHTYLTSKICAWISPWVPDTILTNSHNAHTNHVKVGYSDKKFQVIPNGFDMDQFKPNPAMKIKLKQELGIPESALILGTVGRFHYQKDFNTFVKAAAILGEKYPDLHFCMCGPKINAENELLMSWIKATPLQERIHLLGIRHDVYNILPAYDIFMSSSSCGEAFGNVIGEAMACAVPCVVTDVGDSAIIVGDTGSVVPPRDPTRLAEMADNLLQQSVEQREEIGALARQRVTDEYSLTTIASTYSDFYLQLGLANEEKQQTA